MPTSQELLDQRRAKHEARLAERRAKRTQRRYMAKRERLAILDRDGWTCHICALAIDPDAQWPAPDSGTVDHIVPLAEGGSRMSPTTWQRRTPTATT